MHLSGYDVNHSFKHGSVTLKANYIGVMLALYGKKGVQWHSTKTSVESRLRPQHSGTKLPTLLIICKDHINGILFIFSLQASRYVARGKTQKKKHETIYNLQNSELQEICEYKISPTMSTTNSDT